MALPLKWLEQPPIVMFTAHGPEGAAIDVWHSITQKLQAGAIDGISITKSAKLSLPGMWSGWPKEAPITKQRPLAVPIFQQWSASYLPRRITPSQCAKATRCANSSILPL